MSEANKAIARRFFGAIDSQNVDLLDDVMVEDYIHHDPNLPPEMQRGRDNYKQGASGLRAAFPDMNITEEDMIAEGDKVASRWTVRGTHQGDLMGIPPSGKPVMFAMSVTMRIAGDKIAEGWVNFDALGMMQQIGAIPAPGHD